MPTMLTHEDIELIIQRDAVHVLAKVPIQCPVCKGMKAWYTQRYQREPMCWECARGE